MKTKHFIDLGVILRRARSQRCTLMRRQADLQGHIRNLSFFKDTPEAFPYGYTCQDPQDRGSETLVHTNLVHEQIPQHRVQRTETSVLYCILKGVGRR